MNRSTNLSEILRQDAMLNPKDLGKNVVVTTVSNVEEEQVESVLDIIIESNKKIKFKAVQYSPKQLKLYIYANKEVNLEKVDSKLIKSNVSRMSTEVLYGLSKIIHEKNEVDLENHISLYELIPVFDCIDSEYKKKKYELTGKIENNIPIGLGSKSSVVVYDSGRESKELRIGVGKLYGNDMKTLTFSKKNGDLHGVEPNLYWAKYLFEDNFENINALYELCEEYDWFTKLSIDCDIINSNLTAHLSSVALTVNGGRKCFGDYPISISNYFSVRHDCYGLHGNSYELLSSSNKNEETIFKNAYVSFESLPEILVSRIKEYRKEAQKENITETTVDVSQSV